MYHLIYEDDLCQEIESYFESEKLTRMWIKLQDPYLHFRSWMLFDDKGALVEAWHDPDAD